MELFFRAVGLHGEGKLDEAERLYREIVANAPLHFDALHLLGVIHHQKGRNVEAVDFMRRAIAVNGEIPAVHSNLGLALQALGRHPEALASFDRAVRLDPGFADAWGNRGNALRAAGRFQEAVDSYDRALAAGANAASLLNSRGKALRELKRLEEALASYDRAIQLNPQFGEALFNRGVALLELGRNGDALSAFDGLIDMGLVEAPVYCNRGNALLAAKRPEEALASYDKAVDLDPGLVEAYNNRGNALRDLGRPRDALASFDLAIERKPDYAGALNNRGIALRDLNRQADALASYDQALSIDPGYADALCNRGNVLQDLKRYPEALESYARALEFNPDHAESHWNESLCRLLTGDFRRGWEKYEWRWKTEQAGQVRPFSQPLWLGREPLQGKTILLHAEQGFGDTLHFCRYASRVAALGARVVLEVQPPLKALLASLEGVAEIRARGEALPDFEFHCPLLSLPLAFGTTLATIPVRKAYLHSAPGRIDKWRKRLGNKSQPWVGLVWSGSGGLRNDPSRSMALAEMLKVTGNAGRFVCLQKEIGPADREALARRDNILEFSAELEDFSDTAALVDQMDVVVTVDTAVAHLAGALGKQVWILLPFAPTWRWLLERPDSPWYPSATLFRATALGDWGGVVRQVASRLREEGLAR